MVAAEAERLAAKLLARASLPAEASPLELASVLGHPVDFVDALPGNARGGRDPETCEILIVRSPYHRRVALTIAHELIEHYVPSRLEEQWHEPFCQRGAAALLMPREAFAASAIACDLRLPALKAYWPGCSLEAILTRVADLFPNCTASSWCDGRARFRRAHAGFAPPPDAAELEAFVAGEASYYRRESWVQVGHVAARAWPTSEGRALVLSVSA